MEVTDAELNDTENQMGWDKMRMEMITGWTVERRPGVGLAQDSWSCEGHRALVHSVKQASAMGN